MATLKITTAQLLANDVGTGLSVSAVAQPTGGGSLTFDGSTIVYTAGLSNSTDSFAYTVKDSSNQTSTATVAISISRRSNAKATDKEFDYPGILL